MLKQANNLVLRLWREEDGAVLAVTVIVFLMLFVMACSVFAIGETIRERVEIQNAADAAAYSAATVQADTMSRLAVLNRAMAWSYIQMGRMEMDYIVDKWLERTVEKWTVDKLKVTGFAALSSCGGAARTGSDDWYAGAGYWQREHVRLNRGQWVAVSDIISARASAAAQGSSYGALAPHIDAYKSAISTMNSAEEDLLDQLPGRIETVVKDILKRNVIDTRNDEVAGGGDFMFVLLQENNAKGYTEVPGQDEEWRFFRFAGAPDGVDKKGRPAGNDPLPEDVFGTGIDDWYVKKYSGGGPGIQRMYEVSAENLVADWKWFGGNWQIVDWACVRVAQLGEGQTEVRAEDVYDSNYEGALCKPRKLKPEYFAKRGALVVGVSRRLNNPFYFVFGDESEAGIFKAFTIDNRQRFMWSVAAARAGFSRKFPDQSGGEYDPTYFDAQIEDLNLRVTDWDAVLLPLHRAWAQGSALAWDGETAGQILSAVGGGGWQPVYGGGGALGPQTAPAGMGGGAANWGAMEGWTVH